ncbi:hypothetical protein [Xenorhabdus japonica]|uniref:Uncharacterized protein n=1 Tax=Xenorhabdus japonica TaxID=53341 RepID=A0A1I4ZB12_9GAMM|nr:hypothetical protein [Xenorhabdus japonica]SFN47482.1 hypothetical protein SAMN05421579_10552 [Xenorhabdus japonica]
MIEFKEALIKSIQREFSILILRITGKLFVKHAGFDIGGTLTVKIMAGCLVLIPDNDDTRTIKQQYQRQQDQLSEIKLRMRELIGDYKNG